MYFSSLYSCIKLSSIFRLISKQTILNYYHILILFNNYTYNLILYWTPSNNYLEDMGFYYYKI